jgi:hypothetical protein
VTSGVDGGGQVIEVLEATAQWDTDGRLSKQAVLAQSWAVHNGLTPCVSHTVRTIVSASSSSLPIIPYDASPQNTSAPSGWWSAGATRPDSASSLVPQV